MKPIEVDIHSVKVWLQQGHDTDGHPIALVDCREPNEYNIAHIDGAILMPMRSWPPPLDQLGSLQGKSVIVHCHHGGRSLRVANWFRANGYPDAVSMTGGIDQWSQEIDPTIPRY